MRSRDGSEERTELIEIMRVGATGGCWTRVDMICPHINPPLRAQTTFLIDSGSRYCIGPYELTKYGINKRPIPPHMHLMGASGGSLEGSCILDLELELEGNKLGLCPFFILEKEGILKYSILGMDILRKHGAIIDTEKQTLTMRDINNKCFTVPYLSSKPLKPTQNCEAGSNAGGSNVIHIIAEGEFTLESEKCVNDDQHDSDEGLTTDDVTHFYEIMRVAENEIQVTDDMDDFEIEIYDLDPEKIDLSYLGIEDQKKVRKVIAENQRAFKKNSEEVGKVPPHLYEAEIHIEEGKYAFRHDYRRNPREEKILEKLEKRFVRQGILSPNDQIPVFRSINMVIKKPGAQVLSLKTARGISDLRQVNALLKPISNAHGTLKNIDTIRDNLKGFNFITKIDYSDAFFSISVKKEHRYILATSGINTGGRGYVYNVLPQECEIAHLFLLTVLTV